MRTLIVTAGLLSMPGCGAAGTDHWLAQLKEGEVVKRREALRELGARATDAARIVPALMEALRDENAYVRHDAAMTLAKFGSDAKEAVAALILARKDKESSVRTAAGSALKKIDPETASKAGIR